MSGEAGEHARFELERRFLAERLPPGAPEDDGWQIADRYLIDTACDCVAWEPLGSGETIYRLAQKDVPVPPDF